MVDLDESDVFEIFGPRAIADEHELMKAPVAGFHRTERGGGWRNFFGPDGHAYEITSRG